MPNRPVLEPRGVGQGRVEEDEPAHRFWDGIQLSGSILRERIGSNSLSSYENGDYSSISAPQTLQKSGCHGTVT
jgi:hypothetical protein